jgi:hypothetical protein
MDLATLGQVLSHLAQSPTISSSEPVSVAAVEVSLVRGGPYNSL